MQRIMNYRDANAVLGSSLSPLNRCLAKRIAMQNNADGSMLVAFVDNRLVSATVVALLKYNITFTDPDGIMSPSTQTYQVSRGSIPTPPSVPERTGYEGSWPQMTPAIEDKTYQLTWVYTGGDTPGGGGDTPSGEQIQIEFTRESPDFVINDVIDIQYRHPNSHEYVTVPNESGTITQNGKTYQFSGWSGGLSSGQTLYMDNISTNQKYVANYIKVQGEDGESIYYHGFVIDNLYVVEDFDSATGTVHIDVDIPADQLVTGQSWSTSYDLPDGISWWPNFTITGQSVSPRAHATCYYDSTNGIRKYYSLDNLFFEPFANSLVNLTALDLNDFTADTCNLYYYDLDGNLYKTRPYNKYNRYTEPDFEHPHLEPGVNWIGWVGPYIEGGIVTEDGNFYCNVEYTNSCQISFVGRSADGVIGNGDLVQPGEIAHDEIIAIKYGSRTQGSTITVPTAPATITKNGNTYEFLGWRDGIHNGDVLSCIDIANGSTAETFLKTYVADYEKVTDNNQDYYLIVLIGDEGDYYEDAPVYVDIKLNGTSVDTISNLRPGVVWYPKINSNETPSGTTTIEARFTSDKGSKAGAVMEYTGTVNVQWLPYSSSSNALWIDLTAFEDETVYHTIKWSITRPDDGRYQYETTTHAHGSILEASQVPAGPGDINGQRFLGFDLSGVGSPVNADAEYWGSFENNKYTIRFLDYDNSVISTQQVTSGSMPTVPANPTRSGYVFKFWTPTVEAATKDQDYKATYALMYTIRFLDYDNRVISTLQVEHGNTPTTPANPSRSGYVFEFWNPTVAVATKNQDYQAVYSKLLTIRFLNGSTVLLTDLLEYGATPSYRGATPTKAGATFSGWSPNISTVTTDQDYVAMFNDIQYTIRFLNYDGSVLQTKTYTYGQTPSYTGSTPTRPDDNTYEYTFSGWSPAITTVTGNKDYTAQYSTNYITYTVEFIDGYDNSTIDSVTGPIGYLVYVPNAPTHAGYKFTGWSPSDPGTRIFIDGNATYTANYEVDNTTWYFRISVDGGPEDRTYNCSCRHNSSYDMVVFANQYGGSTRIQIESDSKPRGLSYDCTCDESPGTVSGVSGSWTLDPDEVSIQLSYSDFN